ncbi:polysaccharide biosynthesis protein, partial [Fulvivirga sp. RKSG066]|uniref:lipopolysaccharide biosynthesis protein n=1 Tax=Fulvivirga aurantia TaxID=2529383 RepID=UPI0012BB754F
MSQLKRLAGDTAIYGVSSILGRSINYLLVMLHTEVFLPTELGVFAYLYSYIGIINVIYTFGMETAFFRFANKGSSKVSYNAACTTVIGISTLLSTLIILNASSVASLIGYPDVSLLIIWLAIILWIDGILAIPFARLRHENKAKLFAALKVGNIFANVGLQLIFLLLLPYLSKFETFSNIYDSSLGIGYIVLANLIANALFLPFLWKYIASIRITISKKVVKPMIKYATPIMIMGVAGMVNEMLGTIMLKNLLPDDFYASMNSEAAVGVYSQTFKLSIFMLLAIQAFRYAGEPFFFSNAADKNAPALFAKVMHYFILLSLLMLVVVSLNVNLIAEIFLRKPEFRVALYLVPILLLGKFLYGIYVNLNVWFKITDKTIYGTYFSILGAAVTIIGNVLLIPIIGYLGSAITTVLCYLTMMLACYFTGKKHYPIPYNFKKVTPYVIISAVLVYLSFVFEHPNFIIDSTIRIIISLGV